ncbi:MAG: hypothetical protein ACR2MD_10570 [Aridibacter sp.]|jgi:hypothetical protein|nr:hypothetical protein [Acidobacteriota bacterium]
MRYVSFIVLVLVVSVTASFPQTRQDAIDEFNGLKERGAALEKAILSLTTEDVNNASTQGLNVFRLLPREKYDTNIFKVRGGGSYYSFTNESYSYNDTPQIGLEQNYLKTGFAGADYGLIADLGQSSPDLAIHTAEFEFLSNYQPPKLIKEIRAEQKKSRNYDTNGLNFKSRVPVTVGNSYLLRAISFDEADTLVWFKVHRQDADGSLIIFWKLSKKFDTPQITTEEDTKLKIKAEKMYRQKGLHNIKVEVAGGIMTISGTVPRERLAEADACK